MNMKKLCKVFVRPTNNKSHLYSNDRNNFKGMWYKPFGFVTGTYPDDLEQFPNQNVTQNQYIYILAPEDDIYNINIGNVVYNHNENEIECIKDAEDLRFHRAFKSKKLLASTDESLNVYDIPLVFQKIYADKGGISEVYVHYDTERRVESSSNYDLDNIIRNNEIYDVVDREEEYELKDYVLTNNNSILISEIK